MRNFIKNRVFPRRVGHREHGDCDGSGSLAHETALNLQINLPPTKNPGDNDGDEVAKPSISNPGESHAQDHGKSSQSRWSPQETVHNPAAHQHCLQPTFEGLPPEIRVRIFEFGLGIEDLRAAVRASPALHRQYSHGGRKLMLQIALDTSLGPAFVDMWAVHYTSKVDLRPPKNTAKERIISFMTKVLDHRRSWAQGASLGESFRDRDLVETSQYYFKVVKPLVAYFSDLFLGNLRQILDEGLDEGLEEGLGEATPPAPLPEGGYYLSTDSDSSSDSGDGHPTRSWLAPFEAGDQVDGFAPQDQAIIDAGREKYLRNSPSRSETVRLIRALYRVQTWCNMFGYGMGLDHEPAFL